MSRRAERQPYLELIDACLTDMLGVDASQARELVAGLARSRRLPSIEHVEAFYVAYALAHPDEDEASRDRAADALLASERPHYEQLMVRTGFLRLDQPSQPTEAPRRSARAG